MAPSATEMAFSSLSFNPPEFRPQLFIVVKIILGLMGDNGSSTQAELTIHYSFQLHWTVGSILYPNIPVWKVNGQMMPASAFDCSSYAYPALPVSKALFSLALSALLGLEDVQGLPSTMTSFIKGEVPDVEVMRDLDGPANTRCLQSIGVYRNLIALGDPEARTPPFLLHPKTLQNGELFYSFYFSLPLPTPQPAPYSNPSGVPSPLPQLLWQSGSSAPDLPSSTALSSSLPPATPSALLPTLSMPATPPLPSTQSSPLAQSSPLSTSSSSMSNSSSQPSRRTQPRGRKGPIFPPYESLSEAARAIGIDLQDAECQCDGSQEYDYALGALFYNWQSTARLLIALGAPSIHRQLRRAGRLRLGGQMRQFSGVLSTDLKWNLRTWETKTRTFIWVKKVASTHYLNVPLVSQVRGAQSAQDAVALWGLILLNFKDPGFMIKGHIPDSSSDNEDERRSASLTQNDLIRFHRSYRNFLENTLF